MISIDDIKKQLQKGEQVKLVLTIETKNETANAPANETANGTVNETVQLNETQKRILSIIQKNKYVTYDEIANQLGVARSTVGRNIDTMKKKSIIRRVGEDKNGHWEILTN